MTKAAEKLGKVGSIFDIDFMKLGVRPVEVLSADSKEVIEKLDYSRPWVMKAEGTSLAKVAELLKAPQVASILDSFYSGFPGSAAAMQGTKRYSTLVKDTGDLRKDVLQELGYVEEHLVGADPSFLQCFTGVQAFGYGEEMSSFGLDANQLPSLRIQTQGHRAVIMMALDKVSSYLKVCKKGEAVTYTDVMDFVQGAQPSTMASFLGMHSDGLCHALLPKNTIAYLPPAWLLQEKAGRAKTF